MKVTGCVSISASALLVAISVGITSSAEWITTFAITAGIKKYKSVIKEKRKKHDEIVLLLRKDKQNTIEVLISRSLIDLNISYNEFVSVNNVLREYIEIKEGMKNPETSVKYTI